MDVAKSAHRARSARTLQVAIAGRFKQLRGVLAMGAAVLFLLAAAGSAIAESGLVSSQQNGTPISATSGGTATISGTVTDPDGNPRPWVFVQAHVEHVEYDWSWFEVVDFAMTDDDGTYTLEDLWEGTFYVEFMDSMYLSQFYDGQTSLRDATSIPLYAGQDRTGVNAQLQLGASVSGQVTNMNGDGLGDIEVEALLRVDGDYGAYSISSINSAVTDSSGYFFIDGLYSGSYTLRFTDLGGTYLTQYFDGQATLGQADFVVLIAPNNHPEPFNVTLQEGAAISGTVTGLDGQGREDIAVQVLTYADGIDFHHANFVTEVVTGADGDFVAGGLLDGRYVLRATCQSGNYVSQYFDGQSFIENADPVSTSVGSPASGIGFVLEPAGAITGRLVCSDGQPISEVNVIAYAKQDGGTFRGTWSSDCCCDAGEFRLGGLPEGDNILRFNTFEAPGGWDFAIDQFFGRVTAKDEAAPLHVSADTPINLGDIVLLNAGTVTGVVTDEDGNPLEGISVYVVSEGPDFFECNDPVCGDACIEYWRVAAGDGPVSTNDQGEFLFRGLGSGSFAVKFNDFSNTFATQFYDGVSGFDDAYWIDVTVEENTPNINAVMLEEVDPPDPVDRILTVTFNSNQGTTVAPIQVTEGGTLETLPPNPTRAGHTFAGWWTDATGGAQLTLQTVITEDITFIARWTPVPVTPPVTPPVAPPAVTPAPPTPARILPASVTIGNARANDPLLVNRTRQLSANVLPANAANRNVTWTSSNTRIVTVNNRGQLRALRPGNAVITVRTNEGNRTARFTVRVQAAPTRIDSSLRTLRMRQGTTIRKPVIVRGNTNTDVTVNWRTTNRSVATLVQGRNSGTLNIRQNANRVLTIRAQQPGSARIILTTQNGRTLTFNVTVQRANQRLNSVRIANLPARNTLNRDAARTLQARVTPQRATLAGQVRWTSSRPRVATIDQTGRVQARQRGETTITLRVGTQTHRVVLRVR